MSKPIDLIILIIVALSLLTGCAEAVTQAAIPATAIAGSGRIATEQRTVSDFHQIKLATKGHVLVTLGEAAGLTIEADDNFLPLIVTRVQNGTLMIELDDAAGPIDLQDTQPINIHVSAQLLDGIEVTGAGSISAAGVKADQVNIKIDGSSEVRLSGEVHAQNIIINGTGSLDTRDLRAAQAHVEIAGTGAVGLWVTDRLDVSITGTGDIQYAGQPTVNQVVSGQGLITPFRAK